MVKLSVPHIILIILVSTTGPLKALKGGNKLLNCFLVFISHLIDIHKYTVRLSLVLYT